MAQAVSQMISICSASNVPSLSIAFWNKGQPTLQASFLNGQYLGSLNGALTLRLNAFFVWPLWPFNGAYLSSSEMGLERPFQTPLGGFSSPRLPYSRSSRMMSQSVVLGLFRKRSSLALVESSWTTLPERVRERRDDDDRPAMIDMDRARLEAERDCARSLRPLVLSLSVSCSASASRDPGWMNSYAWLSCFVICFFGFVARNAGSLV
mmetsp:Transcript_18562/g.45589  ORF Transcript_18562/g.45589 Transcript_18562/m.45589 type:complete len:208 (-) Transcript_18562:170-793(-)